MFEGLTVLVALAICAPAFIFATQKSTWIIDYLFFVVALNRGIRRMVDYENGFFNPYSFISLTPIIVGGLATWVVLTELRGPRNRFGQATTSAIYLYGIAVAGAFVVGLVNSRFAALYALGDYIAPIGLIGFAAIYADRPSVLDRWCHSFAISVVLVAAYGIWQFYTIPSWDAFWVRAVDFEGYLGTLEPTKMTLFSTMSERGPAAAYLCGGLILLLLRPRTLGAIRWPAAVLIVSAMLLTYSRTTVIQAGLAVLVYPLINRGTGVFAIGAVALLVGVFGQGAVGLLPGSEMAASRVGTISSIQEDGSFKGRIRLFKTALEESTTEPLGLGLGSHGLAQRVNKSSREGITDSTGYVETLRTFGWIGTVLIGVLLYRLWRRSSDLVAVGLDDTNVLLFRAWFVSGMAAMFSGSWMFTATFFWVFAGHSLGLYDLALEASYEEEEEYAHWDERYQTDNGDPREDIALQP